MRRMKYVPDVHMTVDGRPVIDNETGKQAVLTFKNVLLRVVNDPLFAKGCESTYKMAVLMNSVRAQIEPHSWTEAELFLEDETWKRACDCIKETHTHLGLPPNLLHNVLPFFESILSAQPVVESILSAQPVVAK